MMKYYKLNKNWIFYPKKYNNYNNKIMNDLLIE